MKSRIVIIAAIILLMFNVIGTSTYAADNKLGDYIQETRAPTDKPGNNTDGQWLIAWVVHINDMDGIPIKDVFNFDGKKIAFLTFDDGPSRNVTPRILDILKQYNIKATFFVVGTMAQSNGEVLKRVHTEGHAIGNHSYDHEYGYLYSNLSNFLNELYSCDSVLKNVLGESFETKLFRFPGGAFEGAYTSYKAALHDRGYEFINWNVSTGDSQYNGVPASLLLQNAKDGSYNKEDIVVLMHDLGTKSTTADALPGIIEFFKAQGYEFRKLK